MIDRRAFLAGSFGSGFLALTGNPALAQGGASDWPNRPIRFVVPFAAGGGSDVVARLLGEDLGKLMNATFVIENQAGQAGSIGASYLVKQPADGYSIMICTPGPQMTNPFIYRSLPYDALKDLTPVIHIAQLPNILVVHPSVEARNVAELIALAKSKPGSLSFASSGLGSSSHLAAELFKSMAGVDMVHVPYRGSGQAVIDLVAGRVQLAIDSYTAMMPFVREGQLRVLGVSTLQPMAEHPEIPPIAASLPDYDATTLLYIVARSGTPLDIVRRLNEGFNTVLKHDAIKARMKDLGMTPSGGTPQELGQIIVSEREKWKRVIEVAGIKAD
jgi:tripartite-type tricarboxylate transporter receptor subunit TctC